MNLDSLLASLEGVKSTGPDRWVARCPAHDDRTPSLAIKLSDDGTTLIHCFAGCDPEGVLDAVGLRFSDLMPERRTDSRIKPQKWLNARDALATLDHEALVVAIIGADFLEHKEIASDIWTRLAAAVHRINDTRAKFARCRK